MTIDKYFMRDTFKRSYNCSFEQENEIMKFFPVIFKSFNGADDYWKASYPANKLTIVLYIPKEDHET